MKSTMFRLCSLTVVALAMLLTFSNCQKDAVQNEAQSDPTHLSVRKCLTQEKLNDLMQAQPEVRENRSRIEAFTTQFVKDYDKTASNRAVVTIPVVVHIVYNTAAQNISNQQIQSQLDVLNRDFRKLNADAASTPSVFKPLAADVEINFCLAKQDPNGSATTGILRKQTSATSYNGDNENMMSAATGGSEIWDRNRYLNIYVVNLKGYLGYAYPPGVPADIDAVVIGYTCFGTTGTAKAPFHLGRTATHEVGHWLNLDHIWGGEGDSCGDSDNVADTPNQAGSNSGVPTFPNISCGNTPNGNMFMNYMDYCDDKVNTMFSLGQKARMQALFGTNGARKSLLTSNGCNAPTQPTACTDNYESNNTLNTAKTIAVNTAITAKIGTATDVDWFSFTTTAAQPKIKISLTNLPLDYDIFLYKNNVLVGSSEKEAYANETITLNNGAVGTYHIKVIGYDGSFDASACYTLKAQLGSANFKIDNSGNTAPLTKKRKTVTTSL